ncbi:16S rRNA (uracil(1498)-N(3))-methyltransferase [Ideonella livida]|uniref:Ribosomal RNA small subunit methyltransferase E n=1 Tax=Ideonella livida TaxID=2707176 RepID=A0A7C9PGT4_9BURK|nr:16S rRNA (uracil(1498)-N(3))-methyltransferase [Ideonella livida]NDY90990.1 16S rRNA (uracil(1498)-N(3))-methyltransferase [Ideonella livida]
MTLRVFVDLPLQDGATLDLPAGAARHVQVLRLQPGDGLVLFNGLGGEWAAQVQAMGRSSVQVVVGVHGEPGREPSRRIGLALGMPANERMDALVEKAVELGVSWIQPLQTRRSVLRLQGERAAKRVQHWQGVAQAAAEQSGRTVLPQVLPILELDRWLAGLPAGPEAAAPGVDRLLLCFRPEARLPGRWGQPLASTVWCLSGPEGGLEEAEEALALARGFAPLRLGPRVLRADTAPLVALSWAAGLLDG